MPATPALLRAIRRSNSRELMRGKVFGNTKVVCWCGCCGVKVMCLQAGGAVLKDSDGFAKWFPW